MLISGRGNERMAENYLKKSFQLSFVSLSRALNENICKIECLPSPLSMKLIFILIPIYYFGSFIRR